MIAAFFADDMSASHAALLASSAFDRRADEPALSPGLVAGGDRIVEALPTSLDAARACGRHLMVALPLAHLDVLKMGLAQDLRRSITKSRWRIGSQDFHCSRHSSTFSR